MNFAKTFASAAIVAVSAFGLSAHAADNNRSTEDRIEQRYDAAMERCDSLSGNEKNVCEERAKAERDTAEAELEAAETKRDANRDAAEQRNEAAYNVAKEQCDALDGDAKDKCLDDAKAKYDQ